MPRDKGKDLWDKQYYSVWKKRNWSVWVIRLLHVAPLTKTVGGGGGKPLQTSHEFRSNPYLLSESKVSAIFLTTEWVESKRNFS